MVRFCDKSFNIIPGVPLTQPAKMTPNQHSTHQKKGRNKPRRMLVEKFSISIEVLMLITMILDRGCVGLRANSELAAMSRKVSPWSKALPRMQCLLTCLLQIIEIPNLQHLFLDQSNDHLTCWCLLTCSPTNFRPTFLHYTDFLNKK